MKKHFLLTFILAAGFSCAAHARDQIRIVGSATVYPFITAAAEQFGQEGTFKTPIVEATGTGGGFKLFCEGAQADTPDINNASRKITESEMELCKKNAVTDIAEIPIGYDGIVLVNKKGSKQFNLTYRQIFMALARELPHADGKIELNRYEKWNDVDKNLPAQDIRIYGPPPTSGTRDTFAELAMEKGCEQFKAFEMRYPDKKERQKKCRLLREDGKYVEAGENYNIIVQKLDADQNALGIMGFGFYDENSSKIQATLIDGVLPTAESIATGSYGLSRTLYIYIKKAHIGLVPGIREFTTEVSSEGAAGENGYMSMLGLIPLSADDRSASDRIY